jgi:hypothetical protein
MLKKIILAMALVATASFATWDKFPVLEQHKGQAEVGLAYAMQGDLSALGIFGAARFTVVQNLELGVAVPYTIFTHFDGEDVKRDGLNNIPLMVRFQFLPILNAFVDVDLPVGDEEVSDDGLGVHFGVQFSQKFGIVNFGSELGLEIRTEGDNEISPPWLLNIGAEADFLVTDMLTPYVGLDFYMWLGEYTHDGDEIAGSDASGTIGVAPYIGLNIAITQMFYADVSASFGFGEDFFGEDTPITLQGKFGVNF